jgi:chromosome segregation ATPase
MSAAAIASDGYLESHAKLTESYRTSMSEIYAEENALNTMMSQLSALSGRTDLTAKEQSQMSAIIGTLNDQVPDLELAYDKTTGALNRSIAAVKTAAGAELLPERQQAELKAHNEALAEQDYLQERLNERISTDRGMTAELNRLRAENPELDLTALEAQRDSWNKGTAEMRTALNETNDIISEIEQSWQEQANAVIDYETAVTTALDKVSESLQAVADNYNAAYDAAYNGISGTVGLFNTLETKSDLSAGKMQAAMESQIAFIAKYEENLQKASQYGLSGGLVANESRSNSTKTIKIELAGSGEIKVDGKLNGDEMWNVFAPRLKPEFIKMLRQEMFEEGDLSYVF